MKTSTTIKYRVTYGPAQEEYRNKRDFDNEEAADAFFKKKDADGFHTNVYKIETITTTKQIA